MDEAALVRNIQDNNFDNYNITTINSITLKSQTIHDNQVITETYVNQFNQENVRSRRDLRMYFHNDSSDLVKKQSRQ